MKAVAQVYSEMLELYKDKNRFAQGYYQKNEAGERCPWREGYSFCAMGAISKFSYTTTDNGASLYDGLSHTSLCCLQRVSEHLYGRCIQHVNDDENGYENVIKALEFARALWIGREPTREDLTMSVNDLIKSREV